MWVLRTRLQAQNVTGNVVHYRTFFSTTIKNEGIRGLYKGTPISLVKNLQMGIQMPLYKKLKEEYSMNPLIAGAASKLCAR